MSKALILLWLGMVLPFALTVLNGGPDGRLPHVFFHPAYIAFLGVGLIGVWLLRRASHDRAISRFALAVGLTAVLAMTGHALEFMAVLNAGGIQADQTVFDTSLHRVAGAITVPMVELAILLVIATTLTVRIVASGRPLGATVTRGIRAIHRWVSLLFVTLIPLLFLFQDAQAVTVLAIGAVTVLLVTGLQMSGRHYLTRWRRRTRRRALHASIRRLSHSSDSVGPDVDPRTDAVTSTAGWGDRQQALRSETTT